MVKNMVDLNQIQSDSFFFLWDVFWFGFTLGIIKCTSAEGHVGLKTSLYNLHSLVRIMLRKKILYMNLSQMIHLIHLLFWFAFTLHVIR